MGGNVLFKLENVQEGGNVGRMKRTKKTTGKIEVKSQANKRARRAPIELWINKDVLPAGEIWVTQPSGRRGGRGGTAVATPRVTCVLPFWLFAFATAHKSVTKTNRIQLWLRRLCVMLRVCVCGCVCVTWGCTFAGPFLLKDNWVHPNPGKVGRARTIQLRFKFTWATSELGLDLFYFSWEYATTPAIPASTPATATPPTPPSVHPALTLWRVNVISFTN